MTTKRTKKPAGAKEIECDLLNRASLFALSRKSWGGSAKADLSLIKTEADKRLLSVTKSLLQSDELVAIQHHMKRVRDWCLARCMPSFLRTGIYFVALTEVERYEEYLNTAARELKDDLVPRFLETYGERKSAARTALKNLFKESDYPAPEDMARRFGIEWNWICFAPADNIPKEVREREVAKLQKAYADAQVQILAALRAGFGDLVNHAAEKLKVVPGKKPPVFKATLVENLQEFFATFGSKNLMQDAELAELVERAQKVMGNVTAEDLRSFEDTRGRVAAGFEEIKKEMDKLVGERKGRRFDFRD